MQQTKNKDLAAIKRTVALYNAVPNVLWSVINLVPVSVFCYNHINLNYLYVFTGISILPMFFPNAFYDKIQISKTTASYKRLGVASVNKFSQNGDIINRLIRRRYPEYKAVSINPRSVNRLIQQTYVFEKFHFTMFVLFLLVMTYAAVNGLFGWAAIIALTNVLYNVYPNLLQQYIRLKLNDYKKRMNIV